MDLVTRAKWDAASKGYDLLVRGAEKRWTPYKIRFFAPMRGKILFLAAGTGLDFQFFPPGQDVTAIDISPKMIERAGPRAEEYNGTLELREMDVHQMSFPDQTFDQIYTACTFCSVPKPIEGLARLRRVLKVVNAASTPRGGRCGTKERFSWHGAHRAAAKAPGVAGRPARNRPISRRSCAAARNDSSA